MRYWIVKGNPSQNDLDEMLVPGKRGRWVTRKPPRGWAKGDGLFFWKSGSGGRCLVGLGTLGKVHDTDDDGDTYFDLRYLTHPFQRRLTIDELRRDAVVGSASFLKAGAAGTLFPLTPEQGERLGELVREADDGARAVLDTWFPANRSDMPASSKPEDAQLFRAPAEPAPSRPARPASPAKPLSEALEAVLPGWLVRLDSAPGSRDPLGLQARAGQLADRILPGLNVFTSRARYYSFLCWSLRVAAEKAPDDPLDAAHRLERLLVLCEALRHREDPRGTCTYIGRRRGERYIAEHADGSGYRLPSIILKNQTSNGALRLYRTSLIDVGLVEEVDEPDDALGLSLTPRGHALAERYGRNVNPSVVQWALTGADSRKREESLSELAGSLCLSDGLDGHERNHLRAALFGDRDNGFKRRETTRILFASGLLSSVPRDDIAGDDADAVEEDGGQRAASAETEGNWGVMRALLQMAPRHELGELQAASAYEVLALGYNRLLGAILEPLGVTGRLPIRKILDATADWAGSDFHHAPAGVWAGHRGVVALADELLDPDRPWQEVVSGAIELLVTAVLDERTRGWLADSSGEPLVQRAFAFTSDAGAASAAEILGALIPDLAAHHHEVSARKGKGSWFALEGDELVRSEPRSMLPVVHSMRFAQLARIAADLHLQPNEVVDAT